MPWECNGCSESPAGYNYIPYYFCQDYGNGGGGNPPDSGGGPSNPLNPNDNSIGAMIMPVECTKKIVGDLNGDCMLSPYEACLLSGNSQEVCDCVEEGGNLDTCLDEACLQSIATTFVESLSIAQKAWWEDNENDSEKTDIENYIVDNGCDDESKQFAVEIIDISIILDIDAVNVWDEYDIFVNQMSISERAIFEDMLPNRKLWYACAAKKASVKAIELYPNSLLNGKGDAFRHALWNGLTSLLIGSQLAEQLTTAHENKPPQPPNFPFEDKENEMDLFNNEIGRQTASYSSLFTITDNILIKLNGGFLRYLNSLDLNSRATYNSILIPTNQ